MSWENLEDIMTQLLALDKAMTVPGSGNGKKEEDIIGLSTITQCKYSEKKNVSILRKDIDRLLNAAKLQNKIPLFVTENNGLKLVSIPDSPIFNDILHTIVGLSLLQFVENNINNITNKSERLEYISLLNRSNNIINAINNKYLDKYNELNIILKSEDYDSIEWQNINQYELFKEIK